MVYQFVLSHDDDDWNAIDLTHPWSQQNVMNMGYLLWPFVIYTQSYQMTIIIGDYDIQKIPSLL